MPDDRGTRGQIGSTMPEAAKPEATQADESVNGSYAEIESAEDTVPYLPPLASYPIQIRITGISQGVPTVYPDEIPEEDG